jgi:hypothetical protein
MLMVALVLLFSMRLFVELQLLNETVESLTPILLLEPPPLMK